MTQKKQHILWLTPGFAADEGDTSCIPPLQDLALQFADSGYKLTIVSLHYPFAKKTFSWNGVPVFCIGGKNKRGIKKIATYFQAWKLLKNIHKQDPIHIIHSFWIGDTSLIAQYFCKINNIRQITTIMGQDALGNNYFSWSWFKKMQLVSLTEQAETFFKNKANLKTGLIPFGMNSKFIADAKPKTIDLLSVGSIIPLKNHLRFLTLVAKLKPVFPSISCLIIGEQHDKAYLSLMQTFITHHELANNVKLLNSIPREKVMQYMAASKCLVHVSLYESEGMVMLEALAHGCKVFSGGNGVIVSDPLFTILPKSTDEQIAMLTEALRNNAFPPSCIPYTIENTFSNYCMLYQNENGV